MSDQYQDFVAGFAERRQDKDGLHGDRAGLFGAAALTLDPAALLGKFLILDENQQLSSFKAQDGGVIWGRGAGGGRESKTDFFLFSPSK